MPQAMWWVLIAIQLATSEVFCFVNLVSDQYYNAWTAMGANPQYPSWSANKTVDGNTSQDYESDSCAIIDLEQNRNTSIWWKIWLQQPLNIAYLEIYFRSDTYNRSAGFSIYTYNTQTFYPLRDPKHLVYHHDPLSGCPSPIMNVTVNSVTQGIVFINERRSGYRSNCPGEDNMYTGIELCEIKVMGCDQNRYTTECDRVCTSRCKNSHCDAFNGSCMYGCSNPKAYTIDCIVCDNGMYVKNKTCLQCHGHCKNGEPCNKLTGRCDNGCDHHGIGEFCQICGNGYYGRSCENNCGHCLNGEPCDKRNGTCMMGCQPHFLYPLCKADTSEVERNIENSTDEKSNFPETALYVAIGLRTAWLIVSVGVIIYQRRRITGLLRNRHSTENTQTRSQTQTQNFVDITQSEEKHEYMYTSLETV